MKDKKVKILYIIPVLIIIAGLCVIGYKAFTYLTTPDDVTYTYIQNKPEEASEEEGELPEATDGVKYQLDDSNEAVVEDVPEDTGGKNSDTAELEELINDLNEKAERQTVLDP